MSKTIFEKIRDREVPGEFVYESDKACFGLRPLLS